MALGLGIQFTERIRSSEKCIRNIHMLHKCVIAGYCLMECIVVYYRVPDKGN